jgi:Xaa-Pro aminopeptidase
MQVAPGEYHLARLARLRTNMRAASLDALVVTSLPNIAYLTGLFASTAVVVVGQDELRLFIDGRYLGPAGDRQAELGQILSLTLVPAGGSFEGSVAETAGRYGAGRIGFEAGSLTFRQHRDLATKLASLGSQLALEATDGLVETLRNVKDRWELGRLRDAAARLSDTAKCIIPKALAGMRERDLAGIVEAELRRAGFDKPAFDTIVASGPNSAIPHYRSGDRRLEAGDFVVLDFGGMLDGYAVDLSRTLVLGSASTKARDLLTTVTAAQQAAFDAVRIGRPATEIDDAARQVLVRAGLGDAFSHGTGHGLGLEVHERPRVARFRPDLPVEPLEAGMVFTLEPGAYLPGWGGVRIEDDVVVTTDGPEWLTDVPRLM